MFKFTDALMIACKAHAGQKDKGGEDYIKHPLHLAFMCKERGYSNETQMAALLHDVVEDGLVTFEELERAECPESVVRALRLLTHVVDTAFIQNRAIEIGGENAVHQAEEDEYLIYISNMSGDIMATRVKLEDLKHNSDLNRIPITAFKNPGKLQRRMLKYAKAKQLLRGGLLSF